MTHIHEHRDPAVCVKHENWRNLRGDEVVERVTVSQISGQDEPLSSAALGGAADPEQRAARGRRDLQGPGGDGV